jgi:hypothetical protein
MKDFILYAIAGALIFLLGGGIGNDQVPVEVHGDVTVIASGCVMQEKGKWSGI